MANAILDHKSNTGLRNSLSVASVFNIIMLVAQSISIWSGEIDGFLTGIITFNSICVSLLVSISGWIFRKSLHEYYSGVFIMRVDSH
jgi:hypothetical protein